MVQKWQLGHCFKCNEKFDPNHKCKNKQLSVLILSNMEEADDNGAEGERIEEERVLGEPVRSGEAMTLSMKSIVS